MKDLPFNKKYLVFLILFVTTLGGCRKSLVKGYTDNSYKNHKISSVVIHTTGASLSYANSVEHYLQHVFGLHNVNVTSYYDLLPPTRSYTAAERRSVQKQAGVDSVLFFSLDHSQAEETLVSIYGTNTTNTTLDVSVHSNRIHGTATSTSNSTYTPIKSVIRNIGGEATLWDWENANIIWTGNFSIESRGTFHQGDVSHAKSAAKGVYIELKKAEHLPVKVN